MKQIYYPIISIIILFFLNSCAGYKPIFGSSDLQFKIAEHSIEGNEKLGNLIYSKLYNISEANKERYQSLEDAMGGKFRLRTIPAECIPNFDTLIIIEPDGQKKLGIKN